MANGAAPSRWLLFETFSGPGAESALLAKGSTRLTMARPGKVMSTSRYRGDVLALVKRVASTGNSVQDTSHDGQRQLVGVPLADTSGHVNGVHAWVGEIGRPPPERGKAGAFYFNLTRRKLSASDELLDLYGVAPERRRGGRLTAEAFHRLLPNSAAAAALAIIVREQAGDEYQTVWVIRRDDGRLRAVDLACRTVAEPGEDGGTDIVMRGLVHDMGPARPAEVEHLLLERQVIEAEAEPGRARAIVNPKNMEILRWIDTPIHGLAWRGRGSYPPGPHPDDQQEGSRIMAGVRASGRAVGIVRMRADTGGWISVELTARQMWLDRQTRAALVTFSAAN